jgi:hypothetical protein
MIIMYTLMSELKRTKEENNITYATLEREYNKFLDWEDTLAEKHQDSLSKDDEGETKKHLEALADACRKSGP